MSDSLNPFEGIFDNIELPNSDERSVETTPIYTGADSAFAAVHAPASPDEQGIMASLGLTPKQQNNICVLARDLYINDKMIDARSVYREWPRFEATQDRMLVRQAGPPVPIETINEFMITDAYKLQMARLGVYLGVHSLNSKQIAFLDMLSDTSSKLSIQGIKRKLSITSIEYTSWLRHTPFREALAKGGNRVIHDAIPVAKAKIARKMEDGDLGFIKFGFEVTGEYNPNDRKAVDAQALIRVIFEVLEEEIKDPAILKRIGAKVQLRGSGGNVADTVQGSIEE